MTHFTQSTASARRGGGPPLAVSALPAALGMELTAALARRGWQVRQLGRGIGAEALLATAGADVVILATERAGDDDPLVAAEAYRRASGDAALVLLLPPDSVAQWRWAAGLTPFVHAWPMGVEIVADLVCQARRTVEAARGGERPRPAPDAVRRVTLRLGEALEVDGRVIDLGLAERNFLFELAARPGERISKDAEIAGEAGRPVAARECRRRLGRKVGPELAELLVPVLRGEPYRFREGSEVLAVSLDAQGRCPPTRLRIEGRGSLRGLPTDRLEMFA